MSLSLESTRNTDNILIRIEDLKVAFFTHNATVKAVDGINLQIREGQTLGLVGESGCGKTVTALSIMHLVPSPPGKIEEGRIFYKQQDLLQVSREEMRKVRGNQISMIFQEPMSSLNPLFTIGDQIGEAIETHQKLSRKQSRERTIELLNLVGIPSAEQRFREYPHQLSGGMRQRAMIAMAISCEPELLIADEPTTALDVTIQAQILELLESLRQRLNMSILFITHDLGIIAEMADMVAVMYGGKIVEYTEVDKIFTNPRHPYTIGLLNCLPQMGTGEKGKKERLATIPGIVPSLTDLPSGCRFAERCYQVMEHCHREEPALKEIGEYHRVSCWRV
ncbi:MAG: ABC transporter ATP-binding protein [Deltaproteobacteria bacterium]|nr:MAG: ABC transporter ATP-binding protein [Deltaproteobacteria bacterium]